MVALFRRKQNSHDENDDGEGKKGKSGSKEPANTAFKQQRLKAWQPILTPKTVLPVLFIVGLCFAPIGGLLIWGSGNVSQITLDYTGCESADDTLSDLPKYSYKMRSSDSDAPVSQAPQWRKSQVTETPTSSGTQCIIEFDVPADLEPPVFLYYRLTSFYQNHRRYVKSMDADQLKGNAVSRSTLDGGDCKPLAILDDKIVYPCGLIANSMFNGNSAIRSFKDISTDHGTRHYRKRYVIEPQWQLRIQLEEYRLAWRGSQIRGQARIYKSIRYCAPPNWRHKYPQGYNETNVPDLNADEHFHNWMRTAGLPTFTKLYGRNDNEVMQKGRYRIAVDYNFPVSQYGGTKAIVISTVSWIGGKNPFLGWAYIAVAALFVLLGIAGTARHLLRPRKLGDMNMLSWNQPAQAR